MSPSLSASNFVMEEGGEYLQPFWGSSQAITSVTGGTWITYKRVNLNNDDHVTEYFACQYITDDYTCLTLVHGATRVKKGPLGKKYGRFMEYVDGRMVWYDSHFHGVHQSR